MSTHSGPDISNDGLVFAYDMNSTQKSWKGAPTINLATPPNDITSIASAGGTKTLNVIDLPTEVKNASPIGQMADQIVGSGWIAWTNTSVTTGLQYMVSWYVKAYGAQDTITWNWGGSHNGTRTTFNVSLLSGTVSSLSLVAGESYNVKYVENGWWRISCSTTMSGSACYPQINYSAGVYLCGMQIQQSSFVTPFVNGTRSNTQALLDLTRGNTITATSLTYATDGTFSFNGSTNYLSIPNTTLGNGNVAWTISCWMKTTTTTNSLGGGSIISNISGGPVYSMMGVNNGKIVYWTYQSGAWAQKLGIGKTVNDGNWHMLTWVNYSNYTMDMYVDGLLDSNVANSISGNNNPVDVIGRSWAAYFPGSIASLTRYTRALTAAEVQSNFAAYRGRYGI